MQKINWYEKHFCTTRYNGWLLKAALLVPLEKKHGWSCLLIVSQISEPDFCVTEKGEEKYHLDIWTFIGYDPNRNINGWAGKRKDPRNRHSNNFLRNILLTSMNDFKSLFMQNIYTPLEHMITFLLGKKSYISLPWCKICYFITCLQQFLKVPTS